MNTTAIRLAPLLILIIFLAPVSAVFAQADPITAPPGGSPITAPPGGSPITAPDGGAPITAPDRLGNPGEIDTVDDVLNVIDRITNWMFTIFMAVAVIMILIAAFKYLTSGGGEEVAKAHKMILYAVVAIAVAILAKGIVNVVKSIVLPS